MPNFTCLPRVAGPVSPVRGGALVVGEADNGEQAQNWKTKTPHLKKTQFQQMYSSHLPSLSTWTPSSSLWWCEAVLLLVAFPTTEVVEAAAVGEDGLILRFLSTLMMGLDEACEWGGPWRRRRRRRRRGPVEGNWKIIRFIHACNQCSKYNRL